MQLGMVQQNYCQIQHETIVHITKTAHIAVQEKKWTKVIILNSYYDAKGRKQSCNQMNSPVHFEASYYLHLLVKKMYLSGSACQQMWS